MPGFATTYVLILTFFADAEIRKLVSICQGNETFVNAIEDFAKAKDAAEYASAEFNRLGGMSVQSSTQYNALSNIYQMRIEL